MKLKIFIIIILCLVVCAKFANAASFAGFTINDGLVNGKVYVKTNSAISVTFHIYCTRQANETNFSLSFAIGSSNIGSSTPPYTGTNIYGSYTITSADFDSESIGATYLDYQRTVTIDSRTQSLGNKTLALFNGSGTASYSPSYQMIYIPNGGTFDTFPSQYNNTLFNFGSGAYPDATLIPVNDSQPVLSAGQSLYSPDNSTRLTLQNDGNLVVYKKNSSGTDVAVWSSGTQGKASKSLYFQTDGNFVIYGGTPTVNSHGTVLWASGIYSFTGLGSVHYAYYALQNDGNFVFYWPNYNTYNGLVNIIAGASDSPGTASNHVGSLHHTLYSPVQNQTAGANFTPSPL